LERWGGKGRFFWGGRSKKKEHSIALRGPPFAEKEGKTKTLINVAMSSVPTGS